MITINEPQGSAGWHAARTQHFCASEAPAMLGVSKYQTRSELLRQKHTGIAPDVDQAKQRLFDSGHQAEADARLLAEGIVGQDLYPVVGVRVVDGLPLLASFDGLTMDETICWENKLWNNQLAQSCDAGNLEPHYWAQLEHQLLVSGAEKALFTTSDGSTAKTATTWYFPVEERRAQIIAGWKQFAKDLATYAPEVIEAAPVGRTPETLPALHIEVTGMVTASNLAEYKAHAMAVFASVNRDLVTDQDFADAKKAIKWAGDIETRLKAAKDHALSQTESIDVLFKTIDDITEEARRVRLELNNIVKTRDTTIRTEIVASGREAFAEHMAALNTRIAKQPLMPVIPADFAGAIKGMSKFENMRDAVATELARAKIEANKIADHITESLRMIGAHADYAYLFADLPALVLKAHDDLEAVMQNRIAAHKAKEDLRIEEEAKRIAARAEAVAHAKAQDEAASRWASEAAIAKAKTEAEQPAVTLETAPPCHQTVIAIPDVMSPPTMKLGQICERLGFTVTADFMKSLGFEPAATEKGAKLFHEQDFARMCAALVRHIQHVAQGVTA